MPTPPVPRDILQQSIDTWAACGRRQGEAAKKLGLTVAGLSKRLKICRANGIVPSVAIVKYGKPKRVEHPEEREPIVEILPRQLDQPIREALRRPLGLSDLAGAIGVTKGQILDEIEDMQARGVNVREVDGRYTLDKQSAPRTGQSAAQFELTSDVNSTFRFGVVSDNHLGSKYARLDVLNDLYDRFERDGITEVYNCGNWIDGEASFNTHDLDVHGMDAQVRYLAKHYPRREGITTYAIAGDDHEGWYEGRHGVDIGRYAASKMAEEGRTDWVYMGYMEADVRLVNARSGKAAVMRVVHPGGGSAYAISYTMQKLVESYEGGDKPAVVLAGHYHKGEVLNYRGVWIVQAMCTQDQTPFMRKKKIEAHVGGVQVELEQDSETGAITVCNGRMFRYFNRGYYTGREQRYSRSGPVGQPKRTLGGV